MKLAFILLAALSVAASAQTKQERGRRLADEVIAALGGERFLAMRDRVERGRAYSFYREELSGLARAALYTRYLDADASPDPKVLYVLERQAFGKDEDSVVLFERDKGWSITFRGARPINEERLERYRDSTQRSVFYILRQRLREKGLVFEHQGSDIVDNQPVEILDVTDSENRVVTIYLNRSTKLPERQVFFRRDPKTRIRHEEVTIYAKYRDVGGGVQWPFVMQRLRDGEKVFSLFAESVAIDQKLAETLFAVPAGVKILPPAR